VCKASKNFTKKHEYFVSTSYLPNTYQIRVLHASIVLFIWVRSIGAYQYDRTNCGRMNTKSMGKSGKEPLSPKMGVDLQVLPLPIASGKITRTEKRTEQRTLNFPFSFSFSRQQVHTCNLFGAQSCVILPHRPLVHEILISFPTLKFMQEKLQLALTVPLWLSGVSWCVHILDTSSCVTVALWILQVDCNTFSEVPATFSLSSCSFVSAPHNRTIAQSHNGLSQHRCHCARLSCVRPMVVADIWDFPWLSEIFERESMTFKGQALARHVRSVRGISGKHDNDKAKGGNSQPCGQSRDFECCVSLMTDDTNEKERRKIDSYRRLIGAELPQDVNVSQFAARTNIRQGTCNEYSNKIENINTRCLHLRMVNDMTEPHSYCTARKRVIPKILLRNWDVWRNDFIS
jgi:hypothetical protein